MGGDEEPKQTVELVIREQTTAVVEGIKGQVEKMAETTGVDIGGVNPIITDAAAAATTTATTVIVDGLKEVTEALGLKAISESSLTEDQKKLATTIYDTTKASLQSFINDQSLSNTVKITKTLGQLIKQLENAKVDGKAPSGADKKAVAIQLGRILIKEVMPDDKGEKEVLMVYDLTAEPTLEAMIEVSRVVNVAVHEAAQKCCPGLLELFKRAKAVKSAPAK
jgi:hypothetical protein